jgi:hypothetical protein
MRIVSEDRDEDEIDREWNRAFGATLEAEAELLDRLAREALAAGTLTFSRNGRTLTASISPDRRFIEVRLGKGWVSQSLLGSPRPDYYEWRVQVTRGTLATALMEL